MEIFLSQFCGPEDIITPITEGDEKIRLNLNRHPQNYYLPLRNYSPRKFASLILKHRRSGKFWNHISAQKIKERIDPKIWDSYYKFCFERNPWDKTVSHYFINKESGKKGFQITFDEFITKLEKENKWKFNFHLYTDSKKNLLVDFLGKYENLTEDLKKICQRFGFPFDSLAIRAKGNFRPHSKHYSNFYNNNQQELIRKIFQNEIQLMGYKFEKIPKFDT